MKFKLYDNVKIHKNGIIGQIIDIAELNSVTVYTVESNTADKLDDADYPSKWPLYNCKEDEISIMKG